MHWIIIFFDHFFQYIPSRITIGPKPKIPPKSYVEKLVKLTDHTYAYNSLTNFENEERAVTGNGNAESCALKKIVRWQQANWSESISDEFLAIWNHSADGWGFFSQDGRPFWQGFDNFLQRPLTTNKPLDGNGNNKNVTKIPIGKADGSLTIPVQSRPHSYI